ncbi:TetR/AcrR family transcriptional regulator [Mycobacterium colombiense]|uniref:TetR family transcriptional regulator n=1 Tax=Mycobacterium colombiense TaxID=339268 RepID=A0A1A2YJE4_9MYCO|nr:TetR/AcrR family transcriptional regulator [Mycobacterium colombiense]OBI37131.1 TetR family transcriptional regulator [Mycobacterium colombiense]
MGEDLVAAALRAARALGRDVADVPVIAIAREAGISRSTLIRRLGGKRAALDEAVREAGFDPGGQAPVRTRALDAAAALIGTAGLSAVTLEAIAIQAQCSVHSLYAAFGGRDELLRALFERHSPLLQIEDFFDSGHADLATTVRRLYGMITHTLAQEPRVAPALLAEALARPDSPAIQNLLGHNAPRILASLGAWLAGEINTGTIRELPIPLLIQQLLAPIAVHMLIRPAVPQLAGLELPDEDTVCDVFADAFVRAVAAPITSKTTTKARRKS